MPTYAYACKDCGYAFDIVQSFSEDSLTQCPQCQGRLRKKFGNVGVTFKGSGFYRTDSRSSSSSTSSSKESSSTGGDSSSKSSESTTKNSESSSSSSKSSTKAAATSSS